MAKSQAHEMDQKKSNIKTSNTGHAEHPAKKAPMSANKTKPLGGEQTSDGAAVERAQESSRHPIKEPPISTSEKKLKDASLDPHLDKAETRH